MKRISLSSAGLAIVLTFPLGLICGYWLANAWSPNNGKVMVKAAPLSSEEGPATRGFIENNLPQMVVVSKGEQQLSTSNSESAGHIDDSKLTAAEIVDQLNELPASQNGDEIAARLLITLAEKDVEAAIAWIGAEAKIESRSYLYVAVIESYMTDNVYAAGELILSLADLGAKEELAAVYVSQLLQESPEQALDWADGISDESIKSAAKIRVLESMLDTSPVTVLDHVPFVLAEAAPQDVESIITQAAYRMGTEEGVIATSSIEQYSEEIQPIIAYGVVSGWMETDSVAAQAWVQSLGAGETKDNAILSFIDHSGVKNSSDLMHLAEEIDNPETRLMAISTLINSWGEHSPTEAKNALRSSRAISEPHKALILGQLNTR